MRNLFKHHPGVVVETTTVESALSTLHDVERCAVDQAVPKRQREFATGRRCARWALARLGVDNASIPVGTDREPVWPKGVVGSITHSRGFCAAAVTQAPHIMGIGIDAEHHQPLSSVVEASVCRPEELSWIATNTGEENVHWSTVIFSAKECVHKCFFPINRLYLDFHDALVTLTPDEGRFSVEIVNPPQKPAVDIRRLTGQFEICEPWVFTAIVLQR